jgi:Icc-related predicted phosphoesterase
MATKTVATGIVKLLLFSDLHCDREAAESLARRARGADVLVGAGDYTNVRNVKNLAVCLDPLLGTGKPIVLVAGNNESTQELASFCTDWPGAQVLHGSSVTLLGVTFFGVGGGIPVTPFGAWSYDFDEDQATTLLAECPTCGVLVVHSPPKGVVDVSGRGANIGSVAVRDTIIRTAPQLVVCGHVHNCNGQMGELDGTPVVNAGPAGTEWDVRG